MSKEPFAEVVFDVRSIDHRGIAVNVCSLWRDLLRTKPIRRSARGLYKRSDLIALAQSLSGVIEADRLAIEKGNGAEGFCAAQAACDWIEHFVRKIQRSPREINSLNRFVWGYLENTATYRGLLAKRLHASGFTDLADQASFAPTLPRQVYLGFAFGAPTLANLGVARKLRGGRGRHARIVISDEICSILDKNQMASQLLHAQHLYGDGTLLQGATWQKELLALMDGHGIGPQMLIESSARQKMILRLRPFTERLASIEHFESIRKSKLMASPLRQIEVIASKPPAQVEGLHGAEFTSLIWTLESHNPRNRRHINRFKP